MRPKLFDFICSLFLVCGVIYFVVRCTWPGIPIEVDPPPPPPPPAEDTCITPVEITDPPFVTGYMWITDDLATDLTLIVGNQSILLSQDQWNEIDSILESMLEALYPQYDYTVYTDDGDIRRMAIIVDGTNDRQQFYLKAQVRYNGLKHYFGWATQQFAFFGALSYEEHLAVAEAYPSVNMFFWINTEWDSIQYVTVAKEILGECKEGREWANFVHGGPWDPALIQAFVDAGWETVTDIAPPSQDRLVTYLAKSNPPTYQLMYLQDKGYQVIIPLSAPR